MDTIPALPPLFLETIDPGRVRGGLLLTGADPPHPWFTGSRQCDVRTPGGGYLTGFAEFPDGCDGSTALDLVARIFEAAPSPAGMWFDAHPLTRGSTPAERPVVLPGDPDAGQAPSWNEVPGFGGRVLRAAGLPGARLAIVLPGTAHGDLTVEARAGDLACLLRPGEGRPSTWIVLPELGLVGAYWLYARDNASAAMARIAERIVAARPEGTVPVAEAVVAAHAAGAMRYLGDGYRAAADRFTTRCTGDDLDVEVLRWAFLCDATDTEAYGRWTGEVCERLLEGRPRYAATLREAVRRLPTMSDSLDAEGSAVAGKAREAGKAACSLAGSTHWGHPLLTNVAG